MKKIIFLITAILFSVSLIKAESPTDYTYKKDKSFNFIQDNIHFQVFQNGEFDFFLEPENFVAANYQNNGVSITYNSGYNYESYLQYDDYGAIIQIENTPIYYDYYGRISKIGDTRIRYNNRRLIQFGSMFVHYNHYGYFDHYTGYINYYNRHHYYRPYFSFYVRPIFNYCVVSYNPYRRYYTPIRYNYNSYNHRNNARVRRNHIANNTYSRRSIPRRVEIKGRPTSRSVASRTNSTRTPSRSTVQNTRTTKNPNKRDVNSKTRAVTHRSTNTRSNTNSRKQVSNSRTVSKRPSTTRKQSRTTSQNRSVSSRKLPTVRKTTSTKNAKRTSVRKVSNRNTQKRTASNKRRSSKK